MHQDVKDVFTIDFCHLDYTSNVKFGFKRSCIVYIFCVYA